MKHQVIVCDPPFGFSDRLTMSKTKRGASSNYKTMPIDKIKALDVKSIAADDSLLALWVPSSLLQDGLDILNSWGFSQKQTWIWVKTKKDPLSAFKKEFVKNLRKYERDNFFDGLYSGGVKDIFKITDFCAQDILAFGMGRIFRNVHELVLIGTRGKMNKKIKNKSQRTVHFWPVGKHSEKPEGLQDMFDLMFDGKKLEIFARRQRPGWTCIGNEAPETFGQDITDSIEKLKSGG